METSRTLIKDGLPKPGRARIGIVVKLRGMRILLSEKVPRRRGGRNWPGGSISTSVADRSPSSR